MTHHRAGIALGSNLGDSAQLIAQAIDLLKQHAVPSTEFHEAGIYRTAPVDCPPGSPDFLNTAIEMSFAGTPEALLDITQGIEATLGRHRSGRRNEPRVIDLDLLYLGDLTVRSERLTLPHPRLAGRVFVLQPMADICPERVLPGYEQKVSQLLAAATSHDSPASQSLA